MTSATTPLSARNLTLEKLKSRSSDVTFSLKFAIYAIAIGYGAYFTLSESVTLNVIGVILLGVMFAHGVELQHQVLHNQGFKNRTMNEIAGILVGLPMLVSFAGYQASHLRHHRYLGTPQNKEFFDYGDQYGASRLATIGIWLNRFLMPSLYLSVLKNLGRAFMGREMPDETPHVSARMRRDYLIMFASVVALGVASYFTHSMLIVSVWLLPLVLVASPVHALIEMPEHYMCDVSSTDPYVNTRTIVSNGFMNWLTNGNNFHVEHHMMPGLPIDRLHDLHVVISQDIKHLHPTYRDFYAAVFQGRLPQPKANVEKGENHA